MPPAYMQRELAAIIFDEFEGRTALLPTGQIRGGRVFHERVKTVRAHTKPPWAGTASGGPNRLCNDVRQRKAVVVQPGQDNHLVCGRAVRFPVDEEESMGAIKLGLCCTKGCRPAGS